MGMSHGTSTQSTRILGVSSGKMSFFPYVAMVDFFLENTHVLVIFLDLSGIHSIL